MPLSLGQHQQDAVEAEEASQVGDPVVVEALLACQASAEVELLLETLDLQNHPGPWDLCFLDLLGLFSSLHLLV